MDTRNSASASFNRYADTVDILSFELEIRRRFIADSSACDLILVEIDAHNDAERRSGGEWTSQRGNFIRRAAVSPANPLCGLKRRAHWGAVPLVLSPNKGRSYQSRSVAAYIR